MPYFIDKTYDIGWLFEHMVQIMSNANHGKKPVTTQACGACVWCCRKNRPKKAWGFRIRDPTDIL